MAFEFGMFHEFQRTAGMTEEDAFRVSFEQVDAAERWGLDRDVAGRNPRRPGTLGDRSAPADPG